MHETPGERIRRVRIDAGLTQAELALAAAISQPKLSAYERDVITPQPQTLARIIRAARPRPSVLLERHADEIIAAAHRHNIAQVRVFGSNVHGTDTIESDIDFLVTVTPTASLFDLGGFALEAEAILGYPVDVVSDGSTSTAVLERIQRESVPL